MASGMEDMQENTYMSLITAGLLSYLATAETNINHHTQCWITLGCAHHGKATKGQLSVSL